LESDIWTLYNGGDVTRIGHLFQLQTERNKYLADTLCILQAVLTEFESAELVVFVPGEMEVRMLEHECDVKVLNGCDKPDVFGLSAKWIVVVDECMHHPGMRKRYQMGKKVKDVHISFLKTRE
jgi:hypothetical protein